MSTPVSTELLQLISAAVTPVVMISTCAVLILGINSKHQSMSDRIRALMAEYRAPSTPEARLATILQQVEWFRRRVWCSATAHRILYVSIAVFLVSVLLIILGPTGLGWTSGVYGLFLVGSALMLVAVVLELREVWWSDKTLALEMADTHRRPKGTAVS